MVQTMAKIILVDDGDGDEDGDGDGDGDGEIISLFSVLSFTMVALTGFDAGFALKTHGSFVNGSMGA